MNIHVYLFLHLMLYSDGHSTLPLLMSSMTSWGGRPSMVQPTDWAVPRISLIVPEKIKALGPAGDNSFYCMGKGQFCSRPFGTELPTVWAVLFPRAGSILASTGLHSVTQQDWQSGGRLECAPTTGLTQSHMF